MPESALSRVAHVATFPFGLRAHDYGRHAAPELARRLAATGASFAQLAPAKALEGVNDVARDFGTEEARDCGKAFAEAGISIAVLGCYVDLASGDAGKAALAKGRFEASLAVAPLLGSPPVGLEAGRGGLIRFADGSRRLAFVRALAALVRRAEETGQRVALEAARGHIVASPKDMARILAEIASPALCVILDPVNLIPDGRPSSALARTARLIDAALGKIVAIHIKDALALPGRALAVPPGAGGLRFRELFDLMADAGLRAPVLVEDCPPGALPAALTVLEEAGVGRVSSAPSPVARGAS